MSTRKTHELKTDPEVFDAVARGDKTFEIRCNDRGFNVGDTLWLRETRATGAQMRAGLAPLIYTGREEFRHVSHVLIGYGLTDGWCCLSFASVVAASPSDTSQGVSRLDERIAFRKWYCEVPAGRLDLFSAWLDGRAALRSEPEPCGCKLGECESKADAVCRMSEEIKNRGAQ